MIATSSARRLADLGRVRERGGLDPAVVAHAPQPALQPGAHEPRAQPAHERAVALARDRPDVGDARAPPVERDVVDGQRARPAPQPEPALPTGVVERERRHHVARRRSGGAGAARAAAAPAADRRAAPPSPAPSRSRGGPPPAPRSWPRRPGGRRPSTSSRVTCPTTSRSTPLSNPQPLRKPNGSSGKQRRGARQTAEPRAPRETARWYAECSDARRTESHARWSSRDFGHRGCRFGRRRADRGRGDELQRHEQRRLGLRHRRRQQRDPDADARADLHVHGERTRAPVLDHDGAGRRRCHGERVHDGRDQQRHST